LEKRAQKYNTHKIQKNFLEKSSQKIHKKHIKNTKYNLYIFILYKTQNKTKNKIKATDESALGSNETFT
jgi:hypothetical protein